MCVREREREYNHLIMDLGCVLERTNDSNNYL